MSITSISISSHILLITAPYRQRPITNQHSTSLFLTEHHVIAHAPAYPQSEHITTASVALKNCSGTPEPPSIHSQTAGRTHREWSPAPNSRQCPPARPCTASGSRVSDLTGDQRGITQTAAPPLWIRQRRCTANIRARRTAWIGCRTSWDFGWRQNLRKTR